MLEAPEAGLVSFYDFWSQGQHVEKGQVIAGISPLKAQPVIARLKVPAHNFGKVAQGQQVRIYLDSYPYQEYGSLEGSVMSISPLPSQGYYHVVVSFPNGLLSQYGKMIPFQQNLQGEAEIVTSNRKLLERIFDGLRPVL